MAGPSEPRRVLRAVMHVDVDLPGDRPGVYPTLNKIIETYPKMGRQAYKMHLERGEVTCLVIEHPVSGLQEHVPINGNVRQMTMWSEAAEKRLSEAANPPPPAKPAAKAAQA